MHGQLCSCSGGQEAADPTVAASHGVGAEELPRVRRETSAGCSRRTRRNSRAGRPLGLPPPATATVAFALAVVAGRRAHPAEHVVDQLDEQLVAAGDVAVERRVGGGQLVGEPAHRERFEPLAIQEVEGRGHDPVQGQPILPPGRRRTSTVYRRCHQAAEPGTGKMSAEWPAQRRSQRPARSLEQVGVGANDLVPQGLELEPAGQRVPDLLAGERASRPGSGVPAASASSWAWQLRSIVTNHHAASSTVVPTVISPWLRWMSALSVAERVRDRAPAYAGSTTTPP